ncbi:MAG: periplasmic heavy metal sensor [Candidatus Krumholzibacteria bacterium]|nr:periplasmic heavy metal sensor [Candidatus Krumholzibacteria bacterium]
MKLALTATGIAFGLALSGFVGPSVSAKTEAVARTQKDTDGSPKAVSPARPEIRPPLAGDDWYCWQCGAANPFPKKHYKDKLHRPMLAPGSDSPTKTMEGKRAGKRPGSVVDRILRHASELELSDEQIEHLQELSHETKRKLIGLRARLQEEQLELRRLTRSDSSDMATLRRQLDSVARKRVDVEATRLSQVLELRKILTDPQRKLIKERRYDGRFKLDQP